MDRVVDIIIPTYHRAQILAERLPSYWRQPEARQIFIIDSGEDRSTETMVAGLKSQSPVPIFYYRFPKHEVQQVCKNYGISQGDAPFVFIGEDDLALPSDHLAVLLEALLRNKVDGVAGRRLYIQDGQSQAEAEAAAPTGGRIFTRFPFEAYFEAFFTGELPVKYLHSNALLRREVFQTSAFDPRYRGNAFREELDFYLSCLRQGKKMLATSRTACFHLRSPRKQGSGSQIRRLRYEWFVWINTLKCFWKNRDVLKTEFNFYCPPLAAVAVIVTRYTNGLWRRLKRKF